MNYPKIIVDFAKHQETGGYDPNRSLGLILWPEATPDISGEPKGKIPQDGECRFEFAKFLVPYFTELAEDHKLPISQIAESFEDTDVINPQTAKYVYRLAKECVILAREQEQDLDERLLTVYRTGLIIATLHDAVTGRILPITGEARFMREVMHLVAQELAQILTGQKLNLRKVGMGLKLQNEFLDRYTRAVAGYEEVQREDQDTRDRIGAICEKFDLQEDDFIEGIEQE